MSMQDPSNPNSAFRSPAGPNAGYEFNDNENEIIKSAASWAQILGVITYITALSNLCSKNFLGMILSAAVGSLFMAVAGAFKKIVTSEGDDVGHLMVALQRFGTILLVRLVASGVVVVAGGLVAVALAARR